MSNWLANSVTTKSVKCSLLSTLGEYSGNRQDLQAFTLVRPTRDNPEPDPLAELHPDNRLFIILCQVIYKLGHLYTNTVSTFHFWFEIVIDQSSVEPLELNSYFGRKHHCSFINIVDWNKTNIDVNFSKRIATCNCRIFIPVDVFRDVDLEKIYYIQIQLVFAKLEYQYNVFMS